MSRGSPFGDGSNREELAIEVDLNLRAGRSTGNGADRIDCGFGKSLPPRLRGLTTHRDLHEMCAEKGIEHKFIQPCKTQQNGFIELFNRTYHDEVLNAYLFENLRGVCEITGSWITICNDESSHSFVSIIPLS